MTGSDLPPERVTCHKCEDHLVFATPAPTQGQRGAHRGQAKGSTKHKEIVRFLISGINLQRLIANQMKLMGLNFCTPNVLYKAQTRFYGS